MRSEIRREAATLPALIPAESAAGLTAELTLPTLLLLSTSPTKFPEEP